MTSQNFKHDSDDETLSSSWRGVQGPGGQLSSSSASALLESAAPTSSPGMISFPIGVLPAEEANEASSLSGVDAAVFPGSSSSSERCLPSWPRCGGLEGGVIIPFSLRLSSVLSSC